jgi:hypothetical protein
LSQDRTKSTLPHKVLLDLEHFTLELGELLWDHPMQGQDGYIIRNKVTGVCEAEGVDYAIAILATHNYDAGLTRRFEDPDGSLGRVPGFDPAGNPGPSGNIH